MLLTLHEDDRAKQFCLIDLKEAIAPARGLGSSCMRMNPAERGVAGARRLAPYLGERMRAATFLGKPIVARELRPQDLKLEIETLSLEEATTAARYLAAVVGHAHARQMNRLNRESWRKELTRNRLDSLDAPNWLWKCIVELLALHERAYLEHCRQYALTAPIRGVR
ncbi:DUF2252 family protein [Methylocystis echinoides]|uniref:DUF2252 family protein n=1 Tax=Methylocystis echinoides TaxID=29468 RepID=UPI00343C6AB1